MHKNIREKLLKQINVKKVEYPQLFFIEFFLLQILFFYLDTFFFTKIYDFSEIMTKII